MSEPLIHDPGNTTEIEFVYAFMSIDDEGLHGIVAEGLPGLGMTPLVFGKRELAHKMIPFAQKVADRTSKTVGLFRFKRDTQLWQSD